MPFWFMKNCLIGLFYKKKINNTFALGETKTNKKK
jgi:hypothetical protein